VVARAGVAHHRDERLVQSGRLTLDLRDARNHAKKEQRAPPSLLYAQAR
jgi:hypothetical protein